MCSLDLAVRLIVVQDEQSLNTASTSGDVKLKPPFAKACAQLHQDFVSCHLISYTNILYTLSFSVHVMPVFLLLLTAVVYLFNTHLSQPALVFFLLFFLSVRGAPPPPMPCSLTCSTIFRLRWFITQPCFSWACAQKLCVRGWAWYCSLICRSQAKGWVITACKPPLDRTEGGCKIKVKWQVCPSFKCWLVWKKA